MNPALRRYGEHQATAAMAGITGNSTEGLGGAWQNSGCGFNASFESYRFLSHFTILIPQT